MNTKSRTISTIKAIASSPLFMEKRAALILMNKYNNLVDSGVFENETLLEEHTQRAENLTAVSFYNASKSVFGGKFGSDFADAPSGSVAVVPVMGVMSRDTYCSMSDGFVSGTRDLEKTVEMLDNNESIEGIIFLINTPGGQASGNESLSRKIQACKTPTVGLFEMMASAGVGAFQGVDELYATESSSPWGSIGTYISFYDDRKLVEELGLQLIEVYAEQSTEKNKDFRELLSGNEKPMIEELSKMTTNFINSVKKSRPSIKDDGKVFKGKLYNALEAKKIGAIDGIGDLNLAIKRARYLFKNGKSKKKSNAVKNQSYTMSKEEEKGSWWSSMFGSKTDKEAKEGISSIKSKLTNLQEANQALEEANQALEETGNAQVEKLGELENANTKLTEELTVAKNATAELQKEVESLKAAKNSVLEGTEFETLQALSEDRKKVIEHNIELGGRKKAATPLDDQENVSHAHKSDAGNKPLTIKEKVNAVEEKIKAEAKAKEEAKEEK